MTLIQLRRIASVLNGGTPTIDELNWGGGVPWATPVDLAKVNGRSIERTDRTLTHAGLVSGSTLAREESVLVSSRAPIGYTAIARVPMAFNQGCKAVVPVDGQCARFLQYCLVALTETMKASGSGSTFLELSSEALASMEIPDVTPGEQRRIADFLDDRVARIDQIIATRRLQIDAFNKQRSHQLESVLRRIPDTTRASRVVRVLPGFAFPSADYTAYQGDRRLLRGINLTVGCTRWEDIVYWPESRVDEVVEFVLSPGDLVLGMDRPWVGDGLRIARVTEEDERPLLLQRVARISSAVLTNAFMFWAYQSQRFRDQVESDLTGLSVPHLSGEQIGSFEIPVCSLREQVQIVAAIDAGQQSVTTMIGALGRSIELLTEYKQSLITAAVTGELDVTTAGSGIPG